MFGGDGLKQWITGFLLILMVISLGEENDGGLAAFYNCAVDRKEETIPQRSGAL